MAKDLLTSIERVLLHREETLAYRVSMIAEYLHLRARMSAALDVD